MAGVPGTDGGEANDVAEEHRHWREHLARVQGALAASANERRSYKNNLPPFSPTVAGGGVIWTPGLRFMSQLFFPCATTHGYPTAVTYNSSVFPIQSQL